MDKDFNVTDSENETVGIGGSNIPDNNEIKKEPVHERPAFRTPTPISEGTVVTPTPVSEGTVVTPTPIEGAARTAPDYDKTVAFSSAKAENGNPSNNVSDFVRRERPEGGIRTTYVQNSASMPRNNGVYSSYSMNSAPGSFNSQNKSDEGTPKHKKNKKGNLTFGKAALIVIISVLITSLINITAFVVLDAYDIGGYFSDNEKRSSKVSEGSVENPPADVNDEPQYIVEAPDGGTEVAVDIAAPSVVEISTEIVVSGGFFGNYIESGAGSGVIIDSNNGYIITCAHVIDGASAVSVKLRDDPKSYEATIIGSDPQTDIAVIRIDTENLELKAATLANSDDIRVGQTAIAIGNPLGTLGGTVSKGIVSALDREITIDGQKYRLLQVDTSINPGNSGGGLFDAAGNLIGVVNAKSGGNGSGTTIEGLGFAIPINDAMAIATDLIDDGFVGNRAYLGINVVEYDGTQSVDRALYDYIYAGGKGVYFIEYQDGQSGDFIFGDKIIALDSIGVSSRSEISSLLSEYSVGDTVTVTVSRLNSERGRPQMVDVEVVLVSGVPAEG